MRTFSSLQILLGFCLLLGLHAAEKAEESPDPEENRTETDEAEFRQGGIGQQLMSGYSMGGLYGAGNPGALQYAASSTGGSGYVNMLRNLYRPQQSMGLTDKVKHWVKSFMNRRQYVKPYYAPSGLQYSADEFGAAAKPMFVGSSGGYKAISIPLRQLQKYYKQPYLVAQAGESGFQTQPGSSGSAAGSNSFLSYSPGSYAGDNGQFAGASLFGDANTAALFANGGTSSNGGSLFSASNPSGSLYSGGQNSGLFSQGNSGAGSSSSLFSNSEGPSSALFSSQGLYGSSNSPSSYQSSSSNSAGAFSLDGNSNLYASESGNSPYFGSSPGGSRSFLSSLNSGGQNSGAAAAAYGDLFASGASPAATIYNPNQGEQSARGYGTKKASSYGSSSGRDALFMSSSDQRVAESSPSYSVKEPPSNFDSSRSLSPAESHSSYSVSFQPADQGKSYGANNGGFQPVSFEYQGKSS